MCIAQLVKSPDCRLEELNVHYFQNPTDQQINQSVECIQLTQIAIDLLHRNTSLKIFCFQHCNFRLFKFDWSSISRLLCDRSSIDATYNSKHMLECFDSIPWCTSTKTKTNELWLWTRLFIVTILSILIIHHNPTTCHVKSRGVQHGQITLSDVLFTLQESTRD